MRTPLIYVAVSVFVAWLAVVPSFARAQAPPPLFDARDSRQHLRATRFLDSRHGG